ncbi:sporulation membrane protein YtaF [Anaeroselena agilis]|uniref:Sporulation membrane protein YtaF n=1 Tax=Anaeroselena agilis TaxID=3063788 RepID=A0ABU3P1E7_9FIRM|nr:sporulation membrane protein YtaF [Selenomonadales bacterium 4137-cl]
MDLAYIILLALAVSLDSFFTGVTYEAGAIRIPPASLAVVGLVTAVFSAIPMLAGDFASAAVDPAVAVWAGSALLFTLGAWNIFQDYLLKKLAFPPAGAADRLTIRLGRIIVSIMSDPEYADFDRSKTISPPEAVYLGVALGLDNMAAIFGACLIGLLPLYTPLVMALIQMALLRLGVLFAAVFAPGPEKRLFYLPGAILVLLAVFRLIK